MKLLALLFFVSAVAHAEPNAHCYRFSVPSPAREPSAAPRAERWCYRHLDDGGTYIFNADGEEVKPELALLVANDGGITQASLGAGQLRFANFPARQFNPLSVPLQEPRDRKEDGSAAADSLKASADAVLARLAAVVPSPDAAYESPLAATTSYKPWRGYWWPRKGMPMLDPLKRYDAFVSSRGTASNTAGWEASHHQYNGVWWEGHCNGWAAAAILRPEPRAVRVDGQSNQTFSISRQKGIASETDYCSPSTFYGYRHRNDSGVSPKEFHAALLYYIGKLHKPIAFNIRSDGPIDNRVISGYTMTVAQTGSDYVYTTKLSYHEYDGAITELPGVAPMKTVTYVYRLTAAADGTLNDGTWLSKRPGFVWIPLSTGGKCTTGNPGMAPNFVSAILGN